MFACCDSMESSQSSGSSCPLRSASPSLPWRQDRKKNVGITLDEIELLVKYDVITKRGANTIQTLFVEELKAGKMVAALDKSIDDLGRHGSDVDERTKTVMKECVQFDWCEWERDSAPRTQKWVEDFKVKVSGLIEAIEYKGPEDEPEEEYTRVFLRHLKNHIVWDFAFYVGLHKGKLKPEDFGLEAKDRRGMYRMIIQESILKRLWTMIVTECNLEDFSGFVTNSDYFLEDEKYQKEDIEACLYDALVEVLKASPSGTANPQPDTTSSQPRKPLPSAEEMARRAKIAKEDAENAQRRANEFKCENVASLVRADAPRRGMNMSGPSAASYLLDL